MAQTELQLENSINTNETSIEEQIKQRFGNDIEKWKKQFGPRKLSVIEVDGKYAILRPIGAAEVSNFSVMMLDGNGFEKATRYLLDELWIDGDEEIRNDEEYFISAMIQVQKVMEVKKSSFLKL